MRVCVMQECGGIGMHRVTTKLGCYSSGNESRDFFRSVKLPLDRAFLYIDHPELGFVLLFSLSFVMNRFVWKSKPLKCHLQDRKDVATGRI